jgi:hypothetical protein
LLIFLLKMPSWWFGYIFCSIKYIFKLSFTFSVTNYHPKGKTSK